MKKQVIITETLEHIVTVDAETDEDAITKVKQMYKNCDIVLTDEDYVCTEFEIWEEN